MHILNEHKIKYLNRRIDEISELQISLANEDYNIIFNIGHRLKGNGETFGFPLISQIGITIENAAITKDKNKLNEAIEELDNFVKESLAQIH